MNIKGSKHLDLQYRNFIEQGLNNNSSKSAIAAVIGMDKSSICKEIKKHAYEVKYSRQGVSAYRTYHCQNIASSGFFTALTNGKVSAIISFCRTLVFIAISLVILPHFLGITGAWIAVPVAEFLTLILSTLMHKKYFLTPGERNYFQQDSIL